VNVAEAIEAWGTAHRDQLDASGIERLGVVWKAVQRSEVGAREFATLDRDGAARIMGLFAEPDRGDVAELLNTIRAWTLTDDSAPSSDVSPSLSSVPAPPAADPSETAPADIPIAAAPVNASDAFVGEMSRPGDNGARGDVDIDEDVEFGEHDPDAAAEFAGEPPLSESLLAILSAVVLLIVLGVAGYFLFFRSSADTPDTAAETTTSVGVEASDQSTAPQADFCTTVGEFRQQDPFAGLTIAQGPAFYESVYNTWLRVAPSAPPEVAGEIAVLANELSAMNDIAAQHNYDANDPAFATAMRTRGFAAIDSASGNISSFTTAQCGFQVPTGVEGIESALPGASAAPEGVDPEVLSDDG